MLSTPNLADLYSRMIFIFGYTPFSYNPSKYRVASPLTKTETDMGHKSVFTYKGLMELLLIHGFKIIKSVGYCYCDSFYGIDSKKEKREVGFFQNRIFVNKLLPKTMREGMLFICKKVG